MRFPMLAALAASTAGATLVASANALVDGRAGSPAIPPGTYAVDASWSEATAVAAIPEPGTVQVFGLGLVILATVTATRRRADEPS